MDIRKTNNNGYEVTHNGRTFRVRREWDGPMKGLWIVTEQDASLKSKGVDHWFRKGVEAKKRDAIRLIEEGGYAN
jgi:hypothetical protein